ncbi:MAG: hypothetical protein JXA30_19120 [Deltaproteobacteria bacterium]|nr:hypothetical protein [Deltaproteobacteria bacterium]
MNKPNSNLTIMRDDARLFTGIWKDAVISIWRSDVDHALLDLVEEDLRKINESIRSDYVVLTILVGERRNPPTEDARVRLIGLVRNRVPRQIATASVLQSEGFTATISRGVITELDRASNRRKQEHQVFSSVEEAINWLAKSLGHDQGWIDELYLQVSEQIAKTDQ